MITYFKFVRVAVKTDLKAPHMVTWSYCTCQGHARTTSGSWCDFDDATCALSSRDMVMLNQNAAKVSKHPQCLNLSPL